MTYKREEKLESDKSKHPTKSIKTRKNENTATKKKHLACLPKSTCLASLA